MKRWFAMVLAAVLTLGTLHALADVLWPPMSDFYEKHRDECVDVDEQRYEAIRDTAYLTEPEGEPTGTIPAGTTITVMMTWHGSWGMANGGLFEDDPWVNLTDFRRLYDRNDFAAQHAHEFIRKSGRLVLDTEASDGEHRVCRIVWKDSESTEDDLPETCTLPFCLWDFPGAEKPEWEGGMEFDENDMINFGPLYRAPDGHLWAYVDDYFYGSIRGWICLDAMSEQKPYTEPGPRYAEDAGIIATRGSTGGDGGGGSAIILPIAATAGVTLTTVILLLVLRKKRQA